jgi:hypothetical protein
VKPDEDIQIATVLFGIIAGYLNSRGVPAAELHSGVDIAIASSNRVLRGDASELEKMARAVKERVQ